MDNHYSWTPTVTFDLFFDNSVNMRYNAEWTNPDGTLWFSEPPRWGNSGADQTVCVSSDTTRKLEKTSTAAIGIYGLKIVNTKNNETIFQAKFKVAKMSLNSN